MSFPRYPKYKASGVEWLGEVPEHWVVTPLKHVVNLRSGGTPSKTNLAYWDGVVPWASSKDLKSELLADTQDHITDFALEDGAASLVPAGSLLIVVRGMILAHTFPVVKALVPMAINQDLKAVTPNAKLTVDYLAWVLRGASRETISRLDEAGHGTKALRMEAWTSIPLPVPPVPEQVWIAAFLDQETAKIDALVAEQRRLMELLREKRQAVISHAVTRGLNPDAPLKPSGIESPEKIPATWEVKRIKYLVSAANGIQMGPFGGMLLDLDSDETGFKVYGQENTISGDFSVGHRWISEKRFNALSNYHIGPGDLLLTRKGSLGNARLIESLPHPGIADSDTIRVRVDEALISETLLEILLHEARYVSEQIALTKRGAILAGLNSETIANIAIILPPLNEQSALMKFIAQETAKFDTLTAEAQRAIDLLQERRTALISAAVTGQIDVRRFASAEAA